MLNESKKDGVLEKVEEFISRKKTVGECPKAQLVKRGLKGFNYKKTEKRREVSISFIAPNLNNFLSLSLKVVILGLLVASLEVLAAKSANAQSSG
jgi:hypothetical protein